MRAPVIAGLDGSAASPRCVAWAAAEARLRCRPLELVHATMLLYRDGSLSEAAYDALEAERARLLTDARAYALALHPGLEVRIRLLAREAGRALVAESEHAELVVVGTGAQEGFGGLLLGSVLLRVAAGARCPVLAIPDSAPEPDAAPAEVVVGVADPQRERPIGWAFEEAFLRGARLTAMQALDARSGAQPGAQPGALPEALDAWRTKYPDVPVTHTAVDRHPARALIAAGHRAAMIVIGAAGRHGGGMARGGVPHALLHQSLTAVAIVP